MLVDGGAAVNLMPYATLCKIGKSEADLTPTDLRLKDFEGGLSQAQGALCVELTIGSKTLSTAFFIIKGKGSYIVLLGRDWIHANCCITSTMHQCLIQWIGDTVEIAPPIQQPILQWRSFQKEYVRGQAAYQAKHGKPIS